MTISFAKWTKKSAENAEPATTMILLDNNAGAETTDNTAAEGTEKVYKILSVEDPDKVAHARKTKSCLRNMTMLVLNSLILVGYFHG